MNLQTRLILLAVLVTVPSPSLAQLPNSWTGAGSSNLWSNPDNWSYGVVPVNSTTNPHGGWDDPDFFAYPLTPDPSDDFPNGNNSAFLDSPGSTVLIDSTVDATAYGVRMGGNRGAPVTLEITGGTLHVGTDPNLAPSVNAVGDHLDIGRGFNDSGDPNSTQRVIMSGGTVITNGLLIPEQFVDNSLADPTDSAPLNGELIMSGGTINARWMNLGQLKGNGRAELSGDAVINIAGNVAGYPANGGELTFNRNYYLNGLPVPSSGNVSLDISDNAAIHIYGHISDIIVEPNASEVARYQSYIDSGELTAWGGTAEPLIMFGNNVITITAGPNPHPIPVNGDYDGDNDVDGVDFLLWQRGESPNPLTANDLSVWETNYGMTFSPASASAAVPEPTTLILSLIGYFVAGATRHGRRRQLPTRLQQTSESGGPTAQRYLV